MIKDNKPYCDLCGRRMLIATEDEDGEEIGFTFDRALAHMHHECFDEQWNREWRQINPCKTECRNQPCERGHDCWFDPPFTRHLPYERYFANRIKGRGRKKKNTETIDERKRQQKIQAKAESLRQMSLGFSLP